MSIAKKKTRKTTSVKAKKTISKKPKIKTKAKSAAKAKVKKTTVRKTKKVVKKAAPKKTVSKVKKAKSAKPKSVQVKTKKTKSVKPKSVKPKTKTVKSKFITKPFKSTKKKADPVVKNVSLLDIFKALHEKHTKLAEEHQNIRQLEHHGHPGSRIHSKREGMQMNRLSRTMNHGRGR